MKRTLAILLALLAAFACFPVPGRAAERPPQNVLKTKPPQSVLTTCGCSGPGDCKCPPGTCDCPHCGAKAGVRLSYADAFAKAVRENKPLVVYVHSGHYSTADELASLLPNCVVCQKQDGLDGCPPESVVVAKPDGRGDEVQVAVLEYAYRSRSATARDVLAALASKQVAPAFNPHQIQYPAAAFRPAFAPAYFSGPAPRFGGGGRRGGGC